MMMTSFHSIQGSGWTFVGGFARLRAAWGIAGLVLATTTAFADPIPAPTAPPRPKPVIESVLSIVRIHLASTPALQKDRILQIEWQAASGEVAGAVGRWRIDLVRLGGTPDNLTDRPNVLWVSPDGTLTAEHQKRSFDP